MAINNWNTCVLSPNHTIRNAIDNLIKSSNRIVLVVDEEGKLIGTISDGDIRRGILEGLSLETLLVEIVHKSALVVSPDISRENVKRLMLESKLQQIPIVDKSNNLIGLHKWDELENYAEIGNLFVVMAGGEGKRLLPHTSERPKPMVMINGKPMLEHILLKAKTNGFRRFVLVVHHMSRIIEDYFGDGRKWGIEINYIKEEKPLGTAGGLALLSNLALEPFVVTNGDVLSNINYSDILQFHLKNRCSATMAVRDYEIVHPFGVVNLEGSNIIKVEEKPIFRSFINAGVYVLSVETISGLTQDAYLDMTDLLESLIIKKEKICAYLTLESWIDVGRPEDLNAAITNF